ncbi:hepatic sodium/bile acid cotransporter-like isoform X2 [Poeciliopsis prolifica]|uniref:hepatic sodium/bile acid cotransporter-like isoform X2 n=1 Tax=Poeciliopsis prolifica TaxID=188132 RepID=UPI002413C115|nr:hepatic sodium/bile acid cotransporter-like isoform X2 [Poeciliopsis prolifica]
MMNQTTGYGEIAAIYNDSIIFGNGSMGILIIPKSMNTAINILMVTILFITMISLGCTMEISKIKAHLLKPKGVAIALVAQFCVMPLTAFSLTKILRMEPIKAVTVLICGCCPGGSLSNIFSLSVKGDMNLSIIMTTCSSIAALVLMPLLLYIFSQGFTGLEDVVPYVGIITALVFTLLPCAIGIFVNHYKPNYSATVTNDVIWMILKPDVLAVAALMPLIGFIMGFVMSVICGLNPQCSRTISMETGCQNIQLCTTILKVAFSPQTIGPLFLFPLLYITFQCAEALLLALCFRCYRRVTAPHGGSKEMEKH